MKQAVHIFRKDLRHHWPEVLVSLALLIAFTWNEPSRWLPENEFPESRAPGVLYGLLLVLVILSWAFLIVRVIQSERLAGDRQYWTTRPLEWKSLLAAKILFIAFFVNAPLLIAQVVLLTKAGLRLRSSFVPELFWMHLELVLFCMLPVAVLAAVTATIVQVVLALLAIGAYVAGVATLASYIPSASFSTGSDALQAVILIGACLVTLVWQYAQRESNRSRALLVIAAGMILILIVATPYRTLVAYQYPLLGAGEQQPVHFALDSVQPSAASAVPDEKKDVKIRIPMLVSGIAVGSIVSADGAMLTIEAPDGRRWNSGWKTAGLRLFPNQQHAQMHFEVEKDFFNKIKSSNVKARIAFALTVFHDKDGKQVIATDSEFAVPGFGPCSIERGYSRNSLQCRYPFRSPTLLVNIASSTTTCPSTKDQPVPQGKNAQYFSDSTDAGPISPVETINLYFWNWDGASDDRLTPSVCAGTPLLFSFPQSAQRARFELEMSGIHISDYRVNNSFALSPGLTVKTGAH
jgi:hypothetical protein